MTAPDRSFSSAPAASKPRAARGGAFGLLAAGGLLLPLLCGMSDAEYDQRRKQFERLPAAAVEQVMRNWDWYRDHPQEQGRLEEIHRLAESDPHKREVVDRYYEWFSKLKPSQQRDLLDRPPAERYQTAVRWIEEERRGREASRVLSDHDLSQALSWLGEWVKKNKRWRMDHLAAALLDESKGPRERILILGFIRYRGREMFDELQAEDLADLRKRMSPGVRKQLEQAGGPREQWTLFQRWLLAAIGAEWRTIQERNRPTPEQLHEIYKKLSRTERDELDALPPEEMQRRLTEQYYQQLRGRPGMNIVFPGPLGGGGMGGPGGMGGGPGGKGWGDRPGGPDRGGAPDRPNGGERPGSSERPAGERGGERPPPPGERPGLREGFRNGGGDRRPLPDGRPAERKPSEVKPPEPDGEVPKPS